MARATERRWIAIVLAVGLLVALSCSDAARAAPTVNGGVVSYEGATAPIRVVVEGAQMRVYDGSSPGGELTDAHEPTAPPTATPSSSPA